MSSPLESKAPDSSSLGCAEIGTCSRASQKGLTNFRSHGGVPTHKDMREEEDVSNATAKSILLGLNWLDRFLTLFIILAMIIGVVIGIAWATLPDLEEYRIGIIMVGLARCIAMVMIWNKIARGDASVCAILVIINSILQIVLYAPFSLWFVNVISGSQSYKLDYGDTAISVLIYLGIPLISGVLTRFLIIRTAGRAFFERKFLHFFGPLSLVGLLYTIIIIFAEQAKHILHNLGPTFRTFVPLVLYFAIMWTLAFFLVWHFSKRYGHENWGYQMAVVQAFTAGSNNFELAIAVCVSVYGADSNQALAATIGPLVEVPVLLALSWIALYAGQKLRWSSASKEQGIDRTSP
ncbi:hypothetical protein L7F22_007214 [Adiantum nelumboides]|nr:hypothetical protein [Adiantum nelumboides]